MRIMAGASFTLRQLGYFVAAADAGSITRAAQACQVSQPGVSQAIDKLERELGSRLVVRQRARGLVLTPAGRSFLPWARSLLIQADRVAAAARAEREEVVGTLTVGCYSTLAPTLVPQLLGALRDAHPGLTLHVEEGSGPHLREWLLTGRVELALLYDFDLAPDLRPTTLATVRHHVLLSAGHRLAAQDAVSLRELAEEPLVPGRSGAGVRGPAAGGRQRPHLRGRARGAPPHPRGGADDAAGGRRPGGRGAHRAALAVVRAARSLVRGHP